MMYPIVPKRFDGAEDKTKIVDEEADDVDESTCMFPIDGAN